MSAIVGGTAPPDRDILLTEQHVHTGRCYWDLRECRWQCSAAPAPRDSATARVS